MSAEEQLLRDALGDELRGELRVLSRDPFGTGALTGFEETGDRPRYWYVDTSGKQVDAGSGWVVGPPDRPAARIWLHPADPRLPALASACFPDAAATLMRRLGVSIDRPPELLVYRPGKRAMFRMRGGAQETYLKIVRPAAAASLVALHDALRAGGVPVPRVTGWTELGVVLTETAAGVPLTSRLADVEPERLLDSVDELRARMAAVDAGREARASLAARHDWYLARIAAALHRLPEPAPAALLEPLATLTRMVASPDTSALALDPERRRTVHGDLHVGQLFVEPRDPSSITGVIDVDTAGLGDPADDEAALLGHLVASISLARAGAQREQGFRRLLDAAAARWLAGGGADRARVAHRTAVHLLAHALAPIERGDLPTAQARLELGLELLRRCVGDPVDAREVVR